MARDPPPPKHTKGKIDLIKIFVRICFRHEDGLLYLGKNRHWDQQRLHEKRVCEERNRRLCTRKGMGVQVDTSEGFKTVTNKHASRLGAEELER